jgi:hypothetical protein
MHTRRYDEYVEGHEDDDIYQEEIAVDQNFMISVRADLTKLDTGDTEFLDEVGSSNKRLRKSKCLLDKKRHERLDARIAEEDFDADDF